MSQTETVPGFRVGDIVETTKGAKFWGRILCFDNDLNMPGCTVMAIDPGFAGCKHVYPLKQLQIRYAPPPTDEVRVLRRIIARVAERAREGRKQAELVAGDSCHAIVKIIEEELN